MVFLKNYLRGLYTIAFHEEFQSEISYLCVYPWPNLHLGSHEQPIVQGFFFLVLFSVLVPCATAFFEIVTPE